MFYEIYYIWSSKKRVKLKKIFRKKKHNVSAFADNNIEKQNEYLEGVKIISFDEMVSICRNDSEVAVAISLIEVDAIVQALRKENINSDVYILTKHCFKNIESNDELNRVLEKGGYY